MRAGHIDALVDFPVRRAVRLVTGTDLLNATVLEGHGPDSPVRGVPAAI